MWMLDTLRIFVHKFTAAARNSRPSRSKEGQGRHWQPRRFVDVLQVPSVLLLSGQHSFPLLDIRSWVVTPALAPGKAALGMTMVLRRRAADRRDDRGPHAGWVN